MQGTWALTLRTLRQDSRQLRFLVLRFGVAFLLVLAVWGMGSRSQYLEAPGRELLSILAVANFFAVSCVGVLLFAPSITEEKEEQTLGLLRMTGIGPAALILGKTIPRLIQLGLVLIVQLPLVWLTPTLGGVDWSLILNVYLLLFGQLISTVALSMLASVVMRTNGWAVVVAGLAVGFWTLSPDIAVDLRSAARAGSVLAELLLLLVEGLAHFSLFARLEELLRSGTRVPGMTVLLGANLLPASVVFLIAIWSFSFWNRHETTQTEWEWIHEKWQRVWYAITGRLWRRKSAASSVLVSGPTSPHDPQRPVVDALPDSIPSGRHRPSEAIWQNAIAWKEYYLIGGGRTGLRIRCMIAGLGAIGLILLETDFIFHALVGTVELAWGDRSVTKAGEAIMVCSFYVFCFDLIYLTVNLFNYEFKYQTWESIQLLPVSLGTICRQRIWGAATHLVPWVVVLVCGL